MITAGVEPKDAGPGPTSQGSDPYHRRMTRRLRRACLAAGAVVLAVGGLAGAASPHAVVGLAWKSCGGGMQCATVAVPVDWSKPQGRQLQMALIRLPATSPSRRI